MELIIIGGLQFGVTETPHRDAQHLRRLCAAHLAARMSGTRCHLVLAGGTFDLGAGRHAVDHLLEILRVHSVVVAAWRQWIASGHGITHVAGGCDGVLVDHMQAFELLREILPTLNAAMGGRVVAGSCLANLSPVSGVTMRSTG